ncbi:tRNA (adenosine(37)-N6)-threonylcarbamoyltransferase complex dimerization subunit type 1 TsaB [Pseudonocardia sp. Cha107L01]|uniref:tRNA (adenosine(37)-N6)-threonylcarbamoyltransferase complex dimerization subunit type 1 TsaB n=1 Tax=Pseudonocardia sp. Cha107L01 TaxID=3457576 RepID=UPI00403EF46A
MLVLALDTATDAVAVGLLEVPAVEGPATVLASRVRAGARQHGEQLMPAVLEVCAAAGRQLADVDAVVCGAGPGPFTGLRVGLVSAAGLGDALGVPVYGVCSLDAVAASALDPVALDPAVGSAATLDAAALHTAAGGVGALLVVSDARRREVYWAAYDGAGHRVAGPAVDTPAALAERVTELGVRRVAGPAAAAHAELLGLAEYPAAGAALAPSPAGLVAAAGDDLRTGADPAPLRPYYLRRPDAVPPAARKRVSLG